MRSAWRTRGSSEGCDFHRIGNGSTSCTTGEPRRRRIGKAFGELRSGANPYTRLAGLARMRPVVVVLGVILLLAGAVWALQGAGYLLGAFMSNDPTWVWIGIVTALAGVGNLAFGVRTGRVAKSS